MKVILLSNVPKLGNKNDIKEVSQGYANNYLIRNKLARPINDNQIESVKKQNKVKEVVDKIHKDLIMKNLQDIKGKKVILVEKASESGSLFSKIHQEEIKEAIKNQLKIDVEASWIKIDEPIKVVGEKEISIEYDKYKVGLFIEIKPEN